MKAPSGLDPQHSGGGTGRPMDDHAVMQSRNGIAARTDAQPGDHRVDEAGQRGAEKRKPEPERVALMLQIRLPDGTWMLEK